MSLSRHPASRLWTFIPALALTLIVAPALADEALQTRTAAPAPKADSESLWSRIDKSLTLGVEYRHFPKDALKAVQHDDNLSLAAEPGAYLDWDNRNQSFTFGAFGRLDEHDSRRSHADIREAFYRYTGRTVEWRIGIRKVFWGVTESAHLVNVINQDDFVEDIDGEAKLGQPMVNLAWFSPVGDLNFYVLPYFRERTFPAADGRPRPLLPIDESATRYTHGDEQSHIDLALRYFNSFGPLDVGLSYFRGTNRDPRIDFGYDRCTVTATLVDLPLLPDPSVQQSCTEAQNTNVPTLFPVGGVQVDVDDPSFIPVYEQIDQAGLDVQYVTGALALKAEALYRRSDTQDFVATVAGFEYSFYDVFGSGIDIGALGEYLYDERGSIETDVARAADRLSRGEDLRFGSIQEARAFADSLRRQSAAVLQNDLFVGTRIALNDLRGSELLAGAARDLDTGAVFASLEASRRLGGSFSVSIVGRLFSQIPVTDPLYGFRDDDYVELTLERFF